VSDCHKHLTLFFSVPRPTEKMSLSGNPEGLGTEYDYKPMNLIEGEKS
jgi:hypothetical protein